MHLFNIIEFEQRFPYIIISLKLKDNLAYASCLLFLWDKSFKNNWNTFWSLLQLFLQIIELLSIVYLKDKCNVFLQDIITSKIFGFDEFIEIDGCLRPLHHLISLYLNQFQHELLWVYFLTLQDTAQKIDKFEEIEIVIDRRRIDCFIFVHFENVAILHLCNKGVLVEDG